LIEASTIVFVLIYMLTILLAATEMTALSVSALIGALLSLWFGLNYNLFTYNEALAFVDIKLLALILGVSIVVEVAERSGLFHVLALYAIKLTGGSPHRLFFSMCFTAAAVSLFLSDTTAILLIAAATGTIARIMKYNPKPYFVSAAIMINLGGSSTLIGSVGNMIIGFSSGLSFTDFIQYLTPCEVLLWLLTSLALYLYYRDQLGEKKEPPTYNPWEVVRDRGLLYKSTIILILFILLLLQYDKWNIGPEAVALGCAVLALAVSGVDPAEVFRRVDWETIFFIAGFFFIVGSIEKTGILAAASKGIFDLARGDLLTAMVLTLWSSGVVSTVVSNIAVALTFVPIIQGLQIIDKTPIWSALVLGTNLGGAATPLSGAVCVMAIGALKREGIKLSFHEFTKIGFITTFIQLIVSTLYLIIRFGLW